ncbi:MAG: hypothetical protein MI784_03480 [Cytophagales bacterium]|nr:hypothetical protein [Cytophagales bacterium]
MGLADRYTEWLRISVFHEYYGRAINDMLQITPALCTREFFRYYGVRMKNDEAGVRLLIGTKQQVLFANLLENRKVDFYFFLEGADWFLDLISNIELKKHNEYFYFESLEKGKELGDEIDFHLSIPGRKKGSARKKGNSTLDMPFEQELRKRDKQVWGVLKLRIPSKWFAAFKKRQTLLPVSYCLTLESREIEWRYSIVDRRGKYDQILISETKKPDPSFFTGREKELIGGQKALEFKSSALKKLFQKEKSLFQLELYKINEHTKKKMVVLLPQPEIKQLKQDTNSKGELCVYADMVVHV